MTKRPAVEPIESVVAEAPSVAAPAKKAAAASVELRDDEIIQLSIRPSPWCILIYSFKLLVGMTLMAAGVVIYAQGQPSYGLSVGLLLIVLVAFIGVVVATLHWASRLYVLTNRRVMRFRGVFSVDVHECGLRQIGDVRTALPWYRSVLHLGSIHMPPVGADRAEMVWEHVSRPEEVHEILARAIGRANSR